MGIGGKCLNLLQKELGGWLFGGCVFLRNYGMAMELRRFGFGGVFAPVAVARKLLHAILGMFKMPNPF